MSERTKKSLLNAQVSLFYYAVQTLLGFWSRRVFYDYLGSEILGLDTTAYSLLNFLNIAELGIGVSIAFFLYRPIFEHDHKTINEIIALQKWIYRRIACVIIVAAIVLMCFFPLIFEKSALPIGYAYATFSVMLVGSLLGYFINYNQIVLSADQKMYKVTVVTQGAGIFFKILLILCLPIVSYPFVLYISTTLAGKLFGCFWLDYTIKKEYPWLNVNGFKGKELLKKYPDVLKKTKQIFVHRISGFVTFSLSPLIMYSFTSLTIVAYYGNYTTITSQIGILLGSVFSSTGPGVGNLIASKDSERIQKVFWELFDSRLCISWIGLFCIYFLIEPFICIWLGPKYLLGKPLLALTLLSSSIFINRTTVDSFISGHGMYRDVWAPVVEMLLTISCSIGLGFLWSIEGVVLGGIIAQTLILGIWKPYFLFSQGLMISPRIYFLRFSGRCILLSFAWLSLYFITKLIPLNSINGYIEFFQYAALLFAISFIIIYGLFYIFTSGIRDFSVRMISMVSKKWKKH